jgi:hypothetical protein
VAGDQHREQNSARTEHAFANSNHRASPRGAGFGMAARNV